MSPPRSLRWLLTASVLAWCGCATAEGAIAVIVARQDSMRIQGHPLDHATLRDIYLKKIRLDDRGHVVVPVNLPAGHPLREAFSLSLLRETSDALQNYWNTRYFHGERPPYVLDSEQAVMRFVAKTKGAVGYVAACHADDSVRVILEMPIMATAEKGFRQLCDDDVSRASARPSR